MKKRRYLIAFVITCAIFFIGFFFGFVMDIQRTDYFSDVNEMNKMNLRSLQLQYELAKDNTFIHNRCSAFRFMFDKSILELENNRERLELYNTQSNIKKGDFEVLKREYTISQINFWYTSMKLKESCESSSDYVTVVYLYSDNKNCPTCDDQAVVLNYYKNLLKQDFLVFAIDERFDSDEPLITLIKQSYNVTKYPALIINGNATYYDLDKEEMGEILCENYMTEETRSIVCQDSNSTDADDAEEPEVN